MSLLIVQIMQGDIPLFQKRDSIGLCFCNVKGHIILAVSRFIETRNPKLSRVFEINWSLVIFLDEQNSSLV